MQSHSTLSRINRNIVECKLAVCKVVEHIPGINRNIVECKYEYKLLVDCGESVLIETLWNVN